MRKTLVLLLMIGLAFSMEGKEYETGYFIENKGQWHSDVLFLARLNGMDVWITKYGVNYTFYKLEDTKQNNRNSSLRPSLDKYEHRDYSVLGHRVLFKLHNHNPTPAKEGLHAQTGYFNYLIGNDPTKHATNVRLYKEAIVKNVYTGIDLRYYFDKGALRYDYIVHVGADPSQIIFKLVGSNKSYINEKGQLVFETRFGEVALADLYVYQKTDRRQVQSQFICMEGERWAIKVGKYDEEQDLIIDPLVYSTYVGGSGTSEALDIALDAIKNIYITGSTFSNDYDVTPGVFQTSFEGFYDVIVSKFDPMGSTLIFSTYLGGDQYEIGRSIAVDNSGNVYITGETSSADFFDTKAGAYQPTYGGGSFDAFVTKLNSDGTDLIYSTYIGGNSADISHAIDIDNFGNAYITGETWSMNYPVTPGAYQTNNQGASDAFITKLNANGAGLIFSSYLGGNSNEYANDIVIDASNQAYITGNTYSANFDVTQGAFQTNTYSIEVFVTKFNSTASNLVYSTKFGGNQHDYSYAITLDNQGNAYITGETWSNDFFVTSNAFKATYSGGDNDAFVTKINSDGSNILYSTFLGSSKNDRGNGIVVDTYGNAYVTGWTDTVDYNITPSGFQTNFEGKRDAFLTILSGNGSNLLYSSFLGGADSDEAYQLTLGDSGKVYVAGKTRSNDFYTTSTAFQPSMEGYEDVFISIFDLHNFIIHSSRSDNYKSFSFQCFPNPANDFITIHSLPGNEFELKDVMGSVLKSHKQKLEYETLSFILPAGIYFISNKFTGETFKIIIEK